MSMILHGLSDFYGNNAVAIPPLDVADKMEFLEKIAAGFNLALRNNVSCLAALSSVLVKIGNDFKERTRDIKFTPQMLHPSIFYRLLAGQIKSKMIHKRELLPKDIWPVKAILAWGAETSCYREQILDCWGRVPYEIYGCTEAGIIAMQSWPKKWMTFLADSVFLEFIPEAESIKSRKDPSYQPMTLLLNEVEDGRIYEIVISSFYGMPFFRYRLGDLVKIVALKDEETGVSLPQVQFHSRADDIIDIAGFTRLSEKTIWSALKNMGIRYEDWTLRKEINDGNAVLHLYIELRDKTYPGELEQLFHEQLKLLDPDYKNMDAMLGLQPVKITSLAEGTFARYLENKQRAGIELAHWKPPHMNCTDAHIAELTS